MNNITFLTKTLDYSIQLLASVVNNLTTQQKLVLKVALSCFSLMTGYLICKRLLSERHIRKSRFDFNPHIALIVNREMPTSQAKRQEKPLHLSSIQREEIPFEEDTFSSPLPSSKPNTREGELSSQEEQQPPSSHSSPKPDTREGELDSREEQQPPSSHSSPKPDTREGELDSREEQQPASSHSSPKPDTREGELDSREEQQPASSHSSPKSDTREGELDSREEQQPASSRLSPKSDTREGELSSQGQKTPSPGPIHGSSPKSTKPAQPKHPAPPKHILHKSNTFSQRSRPQQEDLSRFPYSRFPGSRIPTSRPTPTTSVLNIPVSNQGPTAQEQALNLIQFFTKIAADIPEAKTLLTRIDEQGEMSKAQAISLWMSSQPQTCFATLTQLDLCGAELTELPPEIGKLKNLEQLWLSNNSLTHLPREIGNLKELRELWLDQNQLMALPKDIRKLEKLEVLLLDGNRLQNLPPEIGELKQLKALYLAGNQLAYLPEEMKGLVKLEHLNLSCNQLTAFPEVLHQMPHLKDKHLGDNPFSLQKNDSSPQKKHPAVQSDSLYDFFGRFEHEEEKLKEESLDAFFDELDAQMKETSGDNEAPQSGTALENLAGEGFAADTPFGNPTGTFFEDLELEGN